MIKEGDIVYWSEKGEQENDPWGIDRVTYKVGLIPLPRLTQPVGKVLKFEDKPVGKVLRFEEGGNGGERERD